MTNQAFLSAKQAELVSRMLTRKGIRSAAADIIPARNAQRARLSFSQRQLWILDRLNPELAAYNIPISVQLDGPLDYGALQRSFDVVLARHRILSVHFDQDARGESGASGDVEQTHAGLQSRAPQRHFAIGCFHFIIGG